MIANLIYNKTKRVGGIYNMIKLYNTDIQTNKLESVDTYNRGTWIHMVDPSDDEIKEVCNNVNIKEDFIRYALDNEEKARIDVEDEE